MNCKVLAVILVFCVNAHWSDGNNNPISWFRNMQKGLVKIDDNDIEHIPDENGDKNSLKDLSTMVEKESRDLGINVYIWLMGTQN